MTENNGYHSYNFDYLTEGSNIKIDHSLSVDETDMSDLISKPLGEICAMREESVKKETAAFEKVRQSARDWEKKAAITRQFDRAIEYLKVPEVKHTSNEWIKGSSKFDYTYISNRVYGMSYRIYERSSQRTGTQKYDVNFCVNINSPKERCNMIITEREKVCKSKEEAEKYIQGRIKAYSHLFTETTPPIPKEYAKLFEVYGQLLPGYTVEGEPQQAQENVKSDKKPSIRQELNSIKAAEKNKPVKKSEKTRAEPEIS